MFVQAIAEPILSSTKPMERIDGGTRSDFNFPDAPFLCLERNGESEEAVLFLVQRFCEAHKALFMWESERLFALLRSA